MSSSNRRPAPLTLRPPSPGSGRYSLSTTPQGPSFPASLLASPRKFSLPPSPTKPVTPKPYDDRPRASLDVPRDGREGPPLPAKVDKRLPLPPSNYSGLVSSSRQHGRGAGAYDNKLVSSTLSHLPPLPPLSPSNTGQSGSSSMPPPAALLHPPSMSTSSSFASLAPSRPSGSSHTSSSVVVLPNGTTLSTGTNQPTKSDGRHVMDAIHHSSPNSPWSLLTVHVLPLFAGGPLKTPIEDLNQLCHSHILATAQRVPPSRLVASLTSDLRDFVGSGMLTLKAKFETLEETKIVPRAAEVWSFFWAQVLPYLEGVFLPFTQVRDVPSASASTTLSSTHIDASPIAVRHLLLSGFLLHILLPLLSRLVPLISPGQKGPNEVSPPTSTDLQRVLQMSLVLSTQAKYSTFFPLVFPAQNARRDEEVRDSVESLGKAVRWRMAAMAHAAEEARNPTATPDEIWTAPKRASLHRGPSISGNGRLRRRGWRASANITLLFGPDAPPPSRQNSELVQDQWGRPRLDEEDEEDATPLQSMRMAKAQEASYAPTFTTNASTLTATVRGESLASFADSQKTPQAEFGRRPYRQDSSGSSELTPIVPDMRRR